MGIIEIIAAIGGGLLGLAIVIFFAIMLIQGVAEWVTKNTKQLDKILKAVPIIGMIGVGISILAMIIYGVMYIFR